jgi:hypothetical protein
MRVRPVRRGFTGAAESKGTLLHDLMKYLRYKRPTGPLAHRAPAAETPRHASFGAWSPSLARYPRLFSGGRGFSVDTVFGVGVVGPWDLRDRVRRASRLHTVALNPYGEADGDAPIDATNHQ